jgi:hypothetical protein
MLSSKKYDLLLEFFKKELFKCDMIKNDDSTANFCVNCNTMEWVLIEKIKYDTIYYNSKFFDEFLFKIFDIPNERLINYPYLIRNLLFNSIDVLNEIYYHDFDEGYIKHKILTSTITDKVSVIPNTVELMVERIKERKYERFTET